MHGETDPHVSESARIQTLPAANLAALDDAGLVRATLAGYPSAPARCGIALGRG
jgi:hypothetical protein